MEVGWLRELALPSCHGFRTEIPAQLTITHCAPGTKASLLLAHFMDEKTEAEETKGSLPVTTLGSRM